MTFTQGALCSGGRAEAALGRRGGRLAVMVMVGAMAGWAASNLTEAVCMCIILQPARLMISNGPLHFLRFSCHRESHTSPHPHPRTPQSLHQAGALNLSEIRDEIWILYGQATCSTTTSSLHILAFIRAHL